LRTRFEFGRDNYAGRHQRKAGGQRQRSQPRGGLLNAERTSLSAFERDIATTLEFVDHAYIVDRGER